MTSIIMSSGKMRDQPLERKEVECMEGLLNDDGPE